MGDDIEFRDVGRLLRRRWWVPAILAVAGVVLGVAVSGWIAPIHRAQGTLLVGPINGTVTKSTTLRASEDLATFYADLLRRQVVLEPVVESQHLSMSWEQLRDNVSAVIPDQNARAITLTVADESKHRAVEITVAIFERLIELSPPPSGQTEQGFISEQVSSLRATIKQAETQIDGLEASAAQETSPTRRAALTQQLSDREALLNEWRQTYVDLMAVDPTSDAGGLQVLDDVTPDTSLDRASTARQGALGGAVGAVLGVLIVLRRSGRGPRRSAPAGGGDDRVDDHVDDRVDDRVDDHVDGRVDGQPSEVLVTTAARQGVVAPSEAGSPRRAP
jgi:polysaccharide biosynthesis transport protein